MKKLTGFLLLLLIGSLPLPAAERQMLIVLGLGGDPEYEQQFKKDAELWREAASEAGIRVRVIGDQADGGTLEELDQALETIEPDGNEEFWLILVGHGTAAGNDARFCLRQEDVDAKALGARLERFTRPMVIAALSACSAPFLQELAGPRRIVVTATRSARQTNAPHFPTYFAERLQDPAADLDGDDQTSVLEAFLAASADTTQFFLQEQRVQSENALIEDNADGIGASADGFEGLSAPEPADDEVSADGERARRTALILSPLEAALTPEFRETRNELEQQMAELRHQKNTLSIEEYYAKLEAIALQLAHLYAEAEASAESDS